MMPSTIPDHAALAQLRACAAVFDPDGPPPADPRAAYAALQQAIAAVTTHEQSAEQSAAEASTTLQQSEERFRLFVNAVEEYAIFMLDPHGHVLSWNQGAQRIKGYAAEEILGEHFARFYLPEEVEAGKPAAMLTFAAQQGHATDEGWRLRKDGSRFWASVVVTALYDDNGALRGFGKVTRDLSERKRADEARERLRQQEAALDMERERRAQMETAVQMRDTFLAVAAHELRTPLTTVLGSAELLVRRLARVPAVSPADQRRAAMLLQQAQRLQRLVNGLLDITHLHQDQLHLTREPLDLGRLIQQIADDMQPLLVRHTLTLDLPATSVTVTADRERLEQVLYNLLQNAMKYSPDGGPIAVTLAPINGHAQIQVQDEGIGIAAADLPHIFERFYRSGSPDLARLTGMGVGLYVSQAIVTRHGGSITVESAEGQGSRFTVLLPL